MSDRRKRNAVYLVHVPESFAPQRPWDWPSEILRGVLYVKNVHLEDAVAFCRVFNHRQMGLNLADRQWAIPVKHGRCRQWQCDTSDGLRETQAAGSPLSNVQDAGRAQS